MQGAATGEAMPRLDDINRMLDSLTTNLNACDQREQDARRRSYSSQKPPATTTTATAQRHRRRDGNCDVFVEVDAPLFARSSRADDAVMVMVDPHDPARASAHRPTVVPPPYGNTCAPADAPIIVCANELPSTAGAGRVRAHGGTVASGSAEAMTVAAAAAAVDDTEPWTAPGEWWDAGVRCVFEWLREAFAAALDRDARTLLAQSGVAGFYAWPPVGGVEATAGGASAACSLTLMLRPWTPADRPADAERGRGGGPCGIEARRRDAARDLQALTASAERVIARVEASGATLADRHAALSEAVRGCAACLRTLLRLAHDESDVLRAYGAATREAAVIATRAVGIAQKWIYARAVERVSHAARRYETLDDAVCSDFAHAQDAVRGQRGRFLALWRDLKVRYDAFLADAGLDGADPAAAQAMEALFWRGAGGEPPIEPGSGDDPALAVAAAAVEERGVDPDAFDADALRLLRYYCEHMANVARSMLDRATENVGTSDRASDDGIGDDDDGYNGDNKARKGIDGVDRFLCAADIDDDRVDGHDDKRPWAKDTDQGFPRGLGATRSHPHKRDQRQRNASRTAVDDAVSSVSSEAQRRIAACVAGGDDRARVIAEMRRARDRCRALADRIGARRRQRARLLRPVRRRHARHMRDLEQGQRHDESDSAYGDRAFARDAYSTGDEENDIDEGDSDLLLSSDGDDNDDDDDDGERTTSNDSDPFPEHPVTRDRYVGRPGQRDHTAHRHDSRRNAFPLPCVINKNKGDNRHGIKGDRKHNDVNGNDNNKTNNKKGSMDAQHRMDRQRLEAAMAADAADARAQASARRRLAHIESLMAGMAAQAVESGPHAEWTRATARLGEALAEAQEAWRQAAEARASREAVLEEETTRCLESVAATARAAHESDVGAVLCQWNERQHCIDRRRGEDLRQIAMARRVADEWLATFERKMVYYHEDVACAEAVGAVSEFRAVMGLHAGARGTLVRLAEFADAYEDLAYAWTLAYKIEYGDDVLPPPSSSSL